MVEEGLSLPGESDTARGRRRYVERLDQWIVDESELRRTIRRDHKRAAVAWRIWKETKVSKTWLVDRLGLSSPANVSHVVRRFDQTKEKERNGQVRQWKKLSNHVA